MKKLANPQRDISETLQNRALICVAVFTHLLVGVTWRLWFCPSQSVWSDALGSFPQIPLLEGFTKLPPVVDWLLVVLLGISSCGMVFARDRWQKLSLCGYAFCVVVLVLGNQHRMQPWIYQFTLLVVFALLFPQTRFLRYAKWLLVSIYVFSALSKFDHVFAQTLGQQFIGTVTGWFNVSIDTMGAPERGWLAMVFPAAELAIALGLLFKRTCRPAAIAAILLHLCLLVLLSPIGLGHSLGVLLWNVFFMGLLWILFLQPPKEVAHFESVKADWRSLVGGILIGLPLLEPVGLLDHWPAWQLYAPRNSRVSMLLMADEVDKLPANVQQFVKQDDSNLWAYLDMDAWSLATLGVPNYPQARFQLGVALAVSERSELEGATRVSVLGVARRSDGTRHKETLRGHAELRKASDGFYLNCSGRR